MLFHYGRQGFFVDLGLIIYFGSDWPTFVAPLRKGLGESDGMRADALLQILNEREVGSCTGSNACKSAVLPLARKQQEPSESIRTRPGAPRRDPSLW